MKAGGVIEVRPAKENLVRQSLCTLKSDNRGGPHFPACPSTISISLKSPGIPCGGVLRNNLQIFTAYLSYASPLMKEP